MTPRRGTALAALLSACLLVLSACTGVPTGSAPRTVATIDIGQGDEPAQPGPPAGATPRDVVLGFLAANAIDPSHHDTARKYLGVQARTQWSDATATIVNTISTSNPSKAGVVTVRGRLVGSLNANGVYVPQLQGSGNGGGVESFNYRIGTVKGENRIVDLPAGLVLTTDQFAQVYRQHALYFFDQAHRYLVPDSRWTALSGSRLTAWLVGQLANGPRPDLSSSLTNDTLPTQANARRIQATDKVPISIEVPGSAQLNSTGKRLLAAQISATVTDPTSTEEVRLTDGGNPVPMPGSGTEVTAREAAYAYTPVAPVADVYYLRGGDVVRDGGERLPAKLRDGPFLDSVALAQPGGAAGLTVAGVVGSGSAARLVLGTQTGGYRDTTVRGVLSRPAWVPTPSPGSTAPPEVWIGNGGLLQRVVVSGNKGTASTVSINAGAGGGRIVALRLSPEGSRVAMVIESVNGSRRLFIGSVVRSAGQVRVDALPAISPDGATIDDAGWIGSQKLIAIGSVTGSGDSAIFETNVDGSFWTARSTGSTLPGQPDSVTVAVGQYAWVSTNDTVWRQAGRGWTSPDAPDQTTGTRPVYLE